MKKTMSFSRERRDRSRTSYLANSLIPKAESASKFGTSSKFRGWLVDFAEVPNRSQSPYPFVAALLTIHSALR